MRKLERIAMDIRNLSPGFSRDQGTGGVIPDFLHVCPPGR